MRAPHDAEGCPAGEMGRVGTVESLEGDEAVVELESGGACGEAEACAHCSLFQPGSLQIRVPRGDLQKGDGVHVVVPAYAGYLSIFVVYLLPLLMAVAGFAIGARFEGAGLPQGVSTLLGGGIFVGLAILVAVVANRKLSGRTRYEVHRLPSEPGES